MKDKLLEKLEKESEKLWKGHRIIQKIAISVLSLFTLSLVYTWNIHPRIDNTKDGYNFFTQQRITETRDSAHDRTILTCDNADQIVPFFIKTKTFEYSSTGNLEAVTYSPEYGMLGFTALDLDHDNKADDVMYIRFSQKSNNGAIVYLSLDEYRYLGNNKRFPLSANPTLKRVAHKNMEKANKLFVEGNKLGIKRGLVFLVN